MVIILAPEIANKSVGETMSINHVIGRVPAQTIDITVSQTTETATSIDTERVRLIVICGRPVSDKKRFVDEFSSNCISIHPIVSLNKIPTPHPIYGV